MLLYNDELRDTILFFLFRTCVVLIIGPPCIWKIVALCTEHYKNAELTSVADECELERDVYGDKIKRDFDKLSDAYTFTPDDEIAIQKEIPNVVHERTEKLNFDVSALCIKLNKNSIQIQKITEITKTDQSLCEHYSLTIDEMYADTYDEDSSCLGCIHFIECESGTGVKFSNMTTLDEKRGFYSDVLKYYEKYNKLLIDQIEGKRVDIENIALSVCDIDECIRQKIIQKSKNKFKRLIVMEYTPQGNIIMTHNGDDAFEYYADNQILQTNVEIVGKKFTTTFRCKYLLMNSPTLKPIVKDEPIVKDKRDDNIFVKHKTFRPANTDPTKSSVKFIKKGLIKDFNMMQSYTPPPNNKPSFAEWKNRKLD